MEIYHLTAELNILYITARSFPDGIDAAFDQLKTLLPDAAERTMFGMSKPENGEIVYKAGALENAHNEAARYGLDTFTLKQGDYLCQTVNNWKTDISKIGDTFMMLLKDPRLDPEAYCIEWYKGEDVMCLVKINT